MTILELAAIARQITELGDRIKTCELLFTSHMKAFYAATDAGNAAMAATERDNVHTILDTQMDALSGINLLIKKVDNATKQK